MFVFSSMAIVLYTCGLTFYLTWGLTTLVPKFYQAIFSKKFGFKNVLFCVLYCLPLASIDYWIPDYLEQYTIVSSYLMIGLVYWYNLALQIKYKNNMGDLLFSSRAVSKRFYLVIPFTLFGLWIIHRNFLILSDETKISLKTEMMGIEIDNYLFFICQLFVIVSVIICFYISRWTKLEIREKGLWYFSSIIWQDIVIYSWSQEKTNLLIIQHLNGYGKEIKSKMAIASDEKGQIDSIFQNKGLVCQETRQSC